MVVKVIIGLSYTDADDFEPADAAKSTVTVSSDKWEGEDEEEDVKDAWDLDEEKQNSNDDDAPKAIQRKKKKKLADIIAEKEAAKEAEVETRRKQELAAKAMNTPEGRLAEKLRLQKLEENANLQLAKDMLGTLCKNLRCSVTKARRFP